MQDFKVVGSGIHILPLQIFPVLQSESALHWKELGGGTIGTHFPLTQEVPRIHA